MKKSTAAAYLMILCAMLSACGELEESPAGKMQNSSSETTVTVTSPSESVPEDPADNDSQKDDLHLKDGIRKLFGHETEEEKYYRTMTTTTAATTSPEEYEAMLRKSYTLTVDDNYVVHRTEGEYEDNNLGWVITLNGRQVLDRNAEDEYTYKYSDDCGDYTVTLTAFIDGEYRPVSNTVSYTISREKRRTPEEAEIDGIKDKLKNILKAENGLYEDGRRICFTYRMGFVCDPDHDGEYDMVVFSRGGDEDQYQKVSTNAGDMNMGGGFSNVMEQRFSYFIWFDENSQKDYICAMRTEGNNITVTDCLTDEVLWTLDGNGYTLFGDTVTEEEFAAYGFYDTAVAPAAGCECDNDNVYVSRDHKPSFEPIY
ncbi:MAG: hypothetical protein J5994_03420 [Ruminococcus sp.]|nr:hypothetical protein [Ruminococcus sp.]